MPELTPQEAQELLRQLGVAGFAPEAPQEKGLPPQVPAIQGPSVSLPDPKKPPLPPGMTEEDANIGVFPVPPPNQDRIPVGPYPKEKPSQEQVIQQYIKPKLPDQVLMDMYRAPMEEASEAARRDYERMGTLGAGMQQAMVAARRMRGETPTQEDFAGFQPFTTPFESAQIKTKTENVDNLAKANVTSQKLDPNSPASKAAKLSFYASPEFEMVAIGMSKSDPSLSVYDAKKMLYNAAEGMSQHALEAFQNTMKASGDYSRQRATEALEYASTRHQRALSSQIELEVDNTQSFYDAMNNGSSGISQFLVQAIENATGDKIAPGTTGMQLYRVHPKLVEGYTELLVKRVDNQRAQDRNAALGPGLGLLPVAKTGTQSGPLAIVNMPNYPELSDNEKASRQASWQAMKNLNDTVPRTMYMLDAPGVANLAKQRFGVGDGPRIRKQLSLVAEYAQFLDPAKAKQLAASLEDGTTASDTWLNGIKGLVMDIWGSAQNNVRPKLSYTYDKSIDPEATRPPPVPPVDQRYPAKTYITPDGKYGIYYERLGQFDNVVYVLEPQTMQWKLRKLGKGK